MYLIFKSSSGSDLLSVVRPSLEESAESRLLLRDLVEDFTG